jgi:hypothetical protein
MVERLCGVIRTVVIGIYQRHADILRQAVAHGSLADGRNQIIVCPQKGAVLIINLARIHSEIFDQLAPSVIADDNAIEGLQTIIKDVQDILTLGIIAVWINLPKDRHKDNERTMNEHCEWSQLARPLPIEHVFTVTHSLIEFGQHTLQLLKVLLEVECCVDRSAAGHGAIENGGMSLTRPCRQIATVPVTESNNLAAGRLGLIDPKAKPCECVVSDHIDCYGLLLFSP